MKKKLNLDTISVNSFVTDMKRRDVDTVKGGAKTIAIFTYCCNTDIFQGCLSDDRHTQCCD